MADGILLCRAHHQIIHDNKWVIRREDGRYWLIPPQSIDPDQVPREMVSKNPLVRELQSAGDRRIEVPGG